MRNIILEIPEITLLQNQYLKINRYDRPKEVAKWYWLIREQLGPRQYIPMKKCIIYLERHASGKLPDTDGIKGGAKPLIDCLTIPTATQPRGLSIIEDDNPKCLLFFNALACGCKRGEEKTVLNIWEMPEAATHSKLVKYVQDMLLKWR